MRKRLTYLLCVALIFGPLFLNAQSNVYQITGKVYDKEANETLPFASVFLANTTYGVPTNKEGNYRLQVPKAGTYMMIVSFIGYETFKKQITLDEQKEIVIDVAMAPATNSLGEHVVTHYKRRGYYEEDGKKIATRGPMWKVYLGHFERNFLGTSRFGVTSKIMNPEVLRFEIDEEDSSFKAFASDQLIVENNGLGYQINYVLEDFDLSFKEKSTEYSGYPLFTEMEPRNERQRLNWKRNRWRAYRGSMRHFFLSLYQDNFEEKGFEVTMLDVDMLLNGPKNRIFDRNPAFDPPKQLAYTSFRPGGLLPSKLHEGAKTIWFEEVMLVTDGNNIEDNGYIRPPQQAMLFDFEMQANRRLLQRSWIQLKGKKPIQIASNGYIYNPLDFEVFGYWSYERVGELLPFYFSQENMNDQ